jgi:dolichyl-phosphate beta-glucosyltransferase
MAAEDVVESLEQLVWLLWATASERPFYFVLAVVLPLFGFAIFCVSLSW